MKLNKKTNDILAIAAVIAVIVTGLMLHKEVNHLAKFDNIPLWITHETLGLLLALLIVIHCVQHKFWFKSYKKITLRKKHVTTFLLGLAIFEILTGIIMWSGYQPHFLSITHFAGGILFTLVAAGHVIKRLRLFLSLKP